MIRIISLLALVLTASALAQEPSPRIVKCRLVGFEKTDGAPTELFAATPPNKGEFTRNTVSASIDAKPVDYVVPASGKLSFLASGTENSPVVAIANIPENVHNAFTSDARVTLGKETHPLPAGGPAADSFHSPIRIR